MLLARLSCVSGLSLTFLHVGEVIEALGLRCFVLAGSTRLCQNGRNGVEGRIGEHIAGQTVQTANSRRRGHGGEGQTRSEERCEECTQSDGGVGGCDE